MKLADLLEKLAIRAEELARECRAREDAGASLKTIPWRQLKADWLETEAEMLREVSDP